MHKKLLFTILFISLNLNANEFEQWKAKQDQEFSKSQQEYVDWKRKHDAEFKAYKKAQEEAFKEYKKEIENNWPEAETSTNHKWVEYNKDYTSKKSVDFKNENIKFEVVAKDENEAKKKIEDLYMQLLEDDVKSAYKNDKLESKISKKLNKPKTNIKSDEKIITNVLSFDDMKSMYKNVKTQKLQKVKHKDKFIYKANVKMPPQTMIKKAKLYKNDVNKNALEQKIHKPLVYAIMHSESSFNPMARSHIPAFGLMQIVPRSAGVDSYKYLYGKRKVVSSTYLYDSKRNIKMGSAYLHLLQYKYLSRIKDPISKMYCVIAAYNTGAGNVAKAFTGTTNIRKAANKINTMEPAKVYKHLMKNLPYNETKGYLKKVTDRVASYSKLLDQDKL